MVVHLLRGFIFIDFAILFFQENIHVSSLLFWHRLYRPLCFSGAMKRYSRHLRCCFLFRGCVFHGKFFVLLSLGLHADRVHLWKLFVAMAEFSLTRTTTPNRTNPNETRDTGSTSRILRLRSRRCPQLQKLMWPHPAALTEKASSFLKHGSQISEGFEHWWLKRGSTEQRLSNIRASYLNYLFLVVSECLNPVCYF